MADQWRVKQIPGFRISHPFMAVAPGCPDAPHATRWCKCKVHRSEKDARAYINEQEEEEDVR